MICHMSQHFKGAKVAANLISDKLIDAIKSKRHECKKVESNEKDLTDIDDEMNGAENLRCHLQLNENDIECKDNVNIDCDVIFALND